MPSLDQLDLANHLPRDVNGISQINQSGTPGNKKNLVLSPHKNCMKNIFCPILPHLGSLFRVTSRDFGMGGGTRVRWGAHKSQQNFEGSQTSEECE